MVILHFRQMVIEILDFSICPVNIKPSAIGAEDGLERVKLNHRLPDCAMFLIYRSSLLPPMYCVKRTIVERK